MPANAVAFVEWHVRAPCGAARATFAAPFKSRLMQKHDGRASRAAVAAGTRVPLLSAAGDVGVTIF